MRKRTLIYTAAVTLLFSGCTKEVIDETEEEKFVFGSGETVSVDVMKDDRSYSNSLTIQPGHWQLSEKLLVKGETSIETIGDAAYAFVLGKDTKTEYQISVSDLMERYQAGEECRLEIEIVRTTEAETAEKIFGSIYFADTDETGTEITAREYFVKKTGAASARAVMDHFSTGMGQGREGGIVHEDGSEEFYYQPSADFPRLVKTDDTISAVIEFMNEDDDLIARQIYKYTWTVDEAVIETEKEESHEGDNDWLYETYSGRWDLRDIRYLTVSGEEELSDVEITAERKGVDGQNVRFILKTKQGQTEIAIPEYRFDAVYYPGQEFSSEIKIFCEGEEVQTGVQCALYLAAVELSEEGELLSCVPASWFTTGLNQTKLENFGPLPHDETMSWRNDLQRGYLIADGTFPEGKTDGETMWIVYQVRDAYTGTHQTYNLYEYTWCDEPQEVWTYNPPGY